MGGNFSFPAPYWTNVSQDAKDFISKLLCVDPAKRMTTKQALQHPWIAGHANVPATPVSEHFMTKFREYNKSRKADVQRPVMKADPTSTQPTDAAAAAK